MIYFIQDSNNLAIKIGFTASDTPEWRRRAFQTGNASSLVVLATMPGEMEDEQRLHARFAKANVAGEWFRATPEVLRFILEIKPPAAPPPPSPTLPANQIPITIYLAGKVSGSNWRSTIIDNTTAFRLSPHSDEDWPVLQGAIFGKHHYSGPYFIKPPNDMPEDSHGADAQGFFTVESAPYCHPCGCSGCLDENGEPDGDCPINSEETCAEDCPSASTIFGSCLEAIKKSDLVFAWIDSADCYGTLVELGYAKALDKEIVISGPNRFRDLWFSYHCSHFNCGIIDPRAALLDYLCNHHDYYISDPF